LKIGFGKDGLTINSKKFNPLNMSVNGHGIESNEIGYSQVDAFDILEKLSAAQGSEVSKVDKLKALQSIIRQ
jgi:hypothetical protein